MNTEFDLLVFVGRMHPPHLGHKAVIDKARNISKNVLVLLGSAGSARTVRNPFTYSERKDMILSMYDKLESWLEVDAIFDKTYNDAAWIAQVQAVVKRHALRIANKGETFYNHGTEGLKIGLIGAAKDHTSYYLKLFPQWGSVDVPLEGMIHATHIREGLLDCKLERYQVQDTLLHKNVCDYIFGYDYKPDVANVSHIQGFVDSPHFKQLQKELRFIRDYKKQWEAAPYPVKHVTVDAVIEQSGHVLLVKRKSEPGKGLWALPGGHLEPNERIIDGIIREVREETGLKVPDAVLKGSVEKIEVFDDVNRSQIGRVITHCAYITLADDIKLPKVKGADDAEKAKWVPISELREDLFFDDHHSIIAYFLSL